MGEFVKIKCPLLNINNKVPNMEALLYFEYPYSAKTVFCTKIRKNGTCLVNSPDKCIYFIAVCIEARENK